MNKEKIFWDGIGMAFLYFLWFGASVVLLGYGFQPHPDTRIEWITKSVSVLGVIVMFIIVSSYPMHKKNSRLWIKLKSSEKR